MAKHMHSVQRNQRTLQMQAHFSLCPGTSLLGILLAADSPDSRQWQRHLEGIVPVSASEAQILDAHAYGTRWTMGRRYAGASNGA